MEEPGGFEPPMPHHSEGLAHADQNAGLRGYCTGMKAPLKRVEPMAAHLAPTNILTPRCPLDNSFHN
jgi:SRSO17 transposase